MQKSNFFVKTFSKKYYYFYTKNVFKNDLKSSFFKRALAHQNQLKPLGLIDFFKSNFNVVLHRKIKNDHFTLIHTKKMTKMKPYEIHEKSVVKH